MTIRIGDRRLLGALMDALHGAGCPVSRVADDSCRVSPESGDDTQSFLELRFFARAWAVGHGTHVQVEQ